MGRSDDDAWIWEGKGVFARIVKGPCGREVVFHRKSHDPEDVAYGSDIQESFFLEDLPALLRLIQRVYEREQARK